MAFNTKMFFWPLKLCLHANCARLRKIQPNSMKQSIFRRHYLMIACVIAFHRHTELFRSCNADSDYEAKSQMQEWTKGFVNLPNNMRIPIKDIKKCLPDQWKVCGACVVF